LVQDNKDNNKLMNFIFKELYKKGAFPHPF
jgi:hypothetical protein